MGALVLLLGWSGLRWGEAVALRWSEVNPDLSVLAGAGKGRKFPRGEEQLPSSMDLRGFHLCCRVAGEKTVGDRLLEGSVEHLAGLSDPRS